MRPKIFAASLIAVLLPLIGMAHPMGNFSINHHSTIRFDDDVVAVRYILDFAEIPTYQMFANGEPPSRSLAEEWIRGLRLTLDGELQALHLDDVESQFVPGAGGLSTLRVTLTATAPWKGNNPSIQFVDENFSDRRGWKEVVVPGGDDRSRGLTIYPEDLLQEPPNVVEIHTPSADRDRLAEVLTSQQHILLGLALAFALGAMHALSPGHGKTVVAAYLVGNRGTARHAIWLGAIVTFTHTIGVFALGVVTLFLSRYVVPERLYPWLGFASGMSILGIGLHLFRQRFGKLNHDHTHDVPEGLSFRTLLAMGVSGGIVPCPSALVVLLSAVALHRIGVGLLLIVAFSLGLASVLVIVGILVVKASRLLPRVDSNGRFARILPIVSATLITVIGLGIAAQSLGATNILGGELVLSSGVLFVLGLGLLLGLKHATDADHVVAVTTFVSEERSVWRSCWIGAFWGLGHTLSLAAAGLAVIFLKVTISESLSARLEFLVALMLVALGVRVLFQLRDGDRFRPPQHRQAHFGLRPLLVGMVHGAAGSAALMLLVLSTIRSPVEALLYILVFGFGSIVGMLAISFLLAFPLHWAKGRLATSYKPIQLMAGLFSCVFGLYLGAHIWKSMP